MNAKILEESHSADFTDLLMKKLVDEKYRHAVDFDENRRLTGLLIIMDEAIKVFNASGTLLGKILNNIYVLYKYSILYIYFFW